MAANDVPCCEAMFWAYLVTCVALVAFSGLMSGLTLGLMSLRQVELEVLTKSGSYQERKNAEKILPLVKNQHLLLCTLLIGNALAMEALPIFVDSIMPAWSSILISVTLILVFGELLDWILGKKHSALLRRAELKTLVVMHVNEAGKGGELTHEETTIITGALDLTQNTVKDAMTPISKIFALDIDSKLDDKTMELMMERGHSRVPIYSASTTNIVGFILVKNLIKCRPEDGTPIRNLTIRRIPRVHDRLPLYDMKNHFLQIRSHMAVVVKCKNDVNEAGELERARTGVFKIKINSNSKQQGLEYLPFEDEEVIGIITLEDVMEELLQEEILDETDEYVVAHNIIKINMLSSPRLKSIASPGVGSPVYQYSHSSTPRSSYTTTPVALYSPVSPYIHLPIARPTLSASPGKYVPRSPN